MLEAVIIIVIALNSLAFTLPIAVRCAFILGDWLDNKFEELSDVGSFYYIPLNPIGGLQNQVIICGADGIALASGLKTINGIQFLAMVTWLYRHR